MGDYEYPYFWSDIKKCLNSYLKICREQFARILEMSRKNEMIKYLKVLTLYRNVCAHNERLFSYHTYIDIPDTLLHKKLGISKNGSKYIYGKNDLFSVVITFRYLLPKTDFLLFKKQLFAYF